MAESKGKTKAKAKDKKETKAKTNGNGKEQEKIINPLFYSDPVPLDSKQHKNLGLVKDFGFGFTKEINAVPINLVEMPQICHFYPIAFSPDEAAMPVALLGLRDKENLFVNAKGQWLPNSYIPAYIRRYPFIFSETPDDDKLSLCVDMNDKVVSEKSAQKFFEDNGDPSDLSKNALEFCKSYHSAALQTLEFSKTLVEMDLVADREVQLNVAEGKRINFTGFRIIDEKKLADLPDKDYLKLREKGYMAFVYAHLFSGAQWQRLTMLLNELMK